MKDYLIREKEVCRRVCVGTATLAKWVKEGSFPQPVRTRPNKAWRSSQVDRYVATVVDQELSRGGAQR